MSSGQNGGTVSVNFVLGEDKIGDLLLTRLSLAPCTHSLTDSQLLAHNSGPEERD